MADGLKIVIIIYNYLEHYDHIFEAQCYIFKSVDLRLVMRQNNARIELST